jgi:hypothetical protein
MIIWDWQQKGAYLFTKPSHICKVWLASKWSSEIVNRKEPTYASNHRTFVKFDLNDHLRLTTERSNYESDCHTFVDFDFWKLNIFSSCRTPWQQQRIDFCVNNLWDLWTYWPDNITENSWLTLCQYKFNFSALFIAPFLPVHHKFWLSTHQYCFVIAWLKWVTLP